MAMQVSLGHNNVISLSALSCPCSGSPPFSKPLKLSIASNKLKIGLSSVYYNGIYGIPMRIWSRHRRIMAVASAQPDSLDEGDAKQEVNEGCDLLEKKEINLEEKHKATQLKSRVISGLVIGISGGAIVLAGGWIFTIGVGVAVFIAAREYFGLVRSDGIAVGMTPPPRYVSRVCSVICALMPIWTLYAGHIDISVTSAAFIVATTLLLQRGNPRFAQLSSAMFGLFYCGYLPSFWVKLRCGLSVPALNTKIGHVWPVILGGPTHWTVGLVATLVTASSIIAADTYAYIGGRAFGRTPLINVSPKKTWEGALAGLTGCIATSIILSKIFCWPKSLPSAVALGFLSFFGSLFGDLTESMIKRDAGVKDSGSLIPGHGGVLDRVDSYIFTGALTYSFIKTFLPLFGV